NVEDGKHTEFIVDDDGVVRFEDRLCVPSDQALREKVMTKAHSSPFTVHPDRLCVPSDQALREKVMTEAHSSPFTFIQVKIKHQRASGLLQPLEIPMWK
nr:hypothetical protein [Tanacetum cinerariifolium]